jgi:hypothetical protein
LAWYFCCLLLAPAAAWLTTTAIEGVSNMHCLYLLPVEVGDGHIRLNMPWQCLATPAK